jgi:hypothetical protein
VGQIDVLQRAATKHLGKLIKSVISAPVLTVIVKIKRRVKCDEI